VVKQQILLHRGKGTGLAIYAILQTKRLDISAFKNHETGRHWRAFYFVLPAVHAESKAVEATEDAEAFSGRLLDTYVDFNLIREWFKLCTSTHVTPLSGGSDGKLASESDFESDSLTEFEERVTDPDVCQPKALSFLPNFRLVDVSRRCIVRVEQPIMYAALRVSNSHKPYPVTKLLTFM
jgi:hypothetical protein